MDYKISVIDSEVNFDVIPVLLVKDYPLEKRDYKPFTQAKICLNKEGLTLRLMAFEAIPEEGSLMKAVFNFGGSLFTVDLFSAKKHTFEIDGTDKSSLLPVHFFNGEDLQGKYWGGDFTLTAALIQKYDPNFRPDGVSFIEGNIFKLCPEGKRPHFGSHFPVDWESENPYSNLGRFVMVKY